MANDSTSRTLDRRNFLRSSALFAGALGLSVVPAFATARTVATHAQNPQPPKPEEKPKETPTDPFADGEKPKDGKLIDK
jgi:nitrous oxide reductase